MNAPTKVDRFNVHEAKTHLSKLVARVEAGEEIVIARAGKPVARLVPIVDAPQPPRKPGRFKHLLSTIPSEIWFEPEYSEEELDSFDRHDFDLPPR